MSISIGLDIGGTKIAGAAFSAGGEELAQVTLPTPSTYDAFLEACRSTIAQLEEKTGQGASVGVGAPYGAANMPFISGKPLQQDLQKILGRPVAFANDANCAALAEAVEGAGKGHRAVFGLIIGTGVAGGFILDGKIIGGANGLCGEIGHLPLPYYEPSDGSLVDCGCGQKGCIEKLICGSALARLHYQLTDNDANAKSISAMAAKGNKDALETLDRYFTTVAKAMVTVLHSFDPDIITVSGGLNALPGFYDEVPKRWGKYALDKNPKTKLVPAVFGPMAGLRGAALLGKQS